MLNDKLAKLPLLIPETRYLLLLLIDAFPQLLQLLTLVLPALVIAGIDYILITCLEEAAGTRDL